MNRLGIECLSTFGLHPAEIVRVANDLGCGFVTLNLSPAPNRLPIYPEISLRRDQGARLLVKTALADSNVRLAIMEGFAIVPGATSTHERDLDIAADLGATAICVVSMERDLVRTHDEFSRITEMASVRGLITTTEVGAGVLRTFAKAMAAAEAVGNPSFKLLIDTMHFFRSGATVADLAAIDSALIGHIQLCDVPIPAIIGSYMEEALFERRAPGDGDLPLADFLSLLPAEVVVGLEVPIRSEAEAGVEPHMRLGRCVGAARALLYVAADT